MRIFLFMKYFLKRDKKFCNYRRTCMSTFAGWIFKSFRIIRRLTITRTICTIAFLSIISIQKQQNENLHRGLCIVQQGAWSIVGKQKVQEDAIVLHEIHHGDNHNIVLAEVVDGHVGWIASQIASQLMVTTEITTTSTFKETIERAWETMCMSYRKGYDDWGEQYVADYDQREGILLASTRSKDMTAGTTVSMSIFDEDELIVVICGDPRTLLEGTSPVDDNTNGKLVLVIPFPFVNKNKVDYNAAMTNLDWIIPFPNAPCRDGVRRLEIIDTLSPVPWRVTLQHPRGSLVMQTFPIYPPWYHQ